MAASSQSTATQVGESSCVVVVSIKHALSQKLDVLYATAFNAHFWHPIRSVINPNSNPLVMHLLLVEDVGQVATTTVLTVLHGSHEDTSAALLLSVDVRRMKRGENSQCRWGTRVEVARSCHQSRPCST